MLILIWLEMASRRRITVSLDEETYQFFEEWAKEDDRTVPYLIARVASDFVKERQQRNGKGTEKAKAK